MRFEYKSETIPQQKFQTVANDLGEQGWNLVSASPSLIMIRPPSSSKDGMFFSMGEHEPGFLCVFKRCVEDGRLAER